MRKILFLTISVATILGTRESYAGDMGSSFTIFYKDADNEFRSQAFSPKITGEKTPSVSSDEGDTKEPKSPVLRQAQSMSSLHVSELPEGSESPKTKEKKRRNFVGRTLENLYDYLHKIKK